jgi:hypothetical protein
MDVTVLHEPVAFLLTCVLFSMQLMIAGYLGMWILGLVERHGRRR